MYIYICTVIKVYPLYKSSTVTGPEKASLRSLYLNRAFRSSLGNQEEEEKKVSLGKGKSTYGNMGTKHCMRRISVTKC